MPGNKITFDTVRRIALALPHVEEGTMHGSPALKMRGRLLACLPVHKSAEPDSFAICIDFDQRAELLEAAPESYYLTDHYVNYPIVLVRLSRIHLDALRDLLGIGWRFVSAQTSGRKRTVRRQRDSQARRR